MLADLVLQEIEAHGNEFAPAHRHFIEMTKKMCNLYKEQHETLAAIATKYVEAERRSQQQAGQ